MVESDRAGFGLEGSDSVGRGLERCNYPVPSNRRVLHLPFCKNGEQCTCTCARPKGHPRNHRFLPVETSLIVPLQRLEPKVEYTKSAQIRQFMKDNPGICMEMSMVDIAKQFGVSRELVRINAENFGGGIQSKSTRKLIVRLAALLEEHPEYVLPKRLGGISLTHLAKMLDSNFDTVDRALQYMGYPSRSNIIQWAKKPEKEKAHDAYMKRRPQHVEWMKKYVKSHPEQVRVYNKRAGERYNAKVLRMETCVICEKQFPWTNYKENYYKKHHKDDYWPYICGKKCSYMLRARLRDNSDEL